MKYVAAAKSVVGFVLSPILVAALSSWAWQWTNGEAACYASLDLATPGLVCDGGFLSEMFLFVPFHILVALPLCALLWLLARAFPTVPFRSTVLGLLLVTLVICVGVGIHLVANQSNDAADVLSLLVPALVGVLLPLGASPVPVNVRAPEA